MKKIILLGYMGSGKSTIAKILHDSLGIKKVDTDEMITQSTGASVNQLFASKGELYFRKIENEILHALLDWSESLIISLGGGTPCYYNNHLTLKYDYVVSIYLKASIDTIISRISNDVESRPLIKGKSETELREFIGKHIFERSFYYNHAKFNIDTDHQSPQEIASAIEKMLI